MFFNKELGRVHASIISVHKFNVCLEPVTDIPGAYLTFVTSSDWPLFTNYGRLGRVIGHELSHAFGNMVTNILLQIWWYRVNELAQKFMYSYKPSLGRNFLRQKCEL